MKIFAITVIIFSVIVQAAYQLGIENGMGTIYAIIAIIVCLLIIALGYLFYDVATSKEDEWYDCEME